MSELYVESVGAGEPVVFLHAGVADCRMWDAQVSAFAPHYRVIRYDAQGFGRSPMAATPNTRADDLRSVLRQLAVDRAHVVGLSMGGATAIDFLLTYPSMVGALVVAASGVSGADRDDAWLAEQNRLENAAVARGDFDSALTASLQTWVAGPRRRLEDMPEALVEMLRPMALDVLRHDAERKRAPGIDPPAAGRLAQIEAPFLVMVGDADVDAVLETADVLANGVRGAQKIVLSDTAHMINLERPAEFNAAVLEFLRRHLLAAASGGAV
ncbi:MAG: alpha/beta hydrolase [Chloroflexi bacterium]|nr:alpha/beta hydrolase [Chloroflexota bacterium]